MESHIAKGRIGEEIACRYLEEQGWRILERNWRWLHKEADIIAQVGDELIIVEVKTRSRSVFGSAIEAVDSTKQSNLIALANKYIAMNALELSVRYDILGIDIAPDMTYKITHIQRAFYPRLKKRRGTKHRH